jgi:signal transduction histidine kinase/DNA-binding NarL/FixJ family response regulator
MSRLNIAGIDPTRIEQVVTHRLMELPIRSRLLALPIFGAVAAVLYAGIAPLWMFLVPALVFVVSVWGSWRVQLAYRRAPSAISLDGWRWLYAATSVPTSFANGLMGGFFATLPAAQERTLWALALCLIVSATPSRTLDGRTFTLSAAALVLPMVGVLVLDDGSRAAIGLSAIMLGFVATLSLWSHFERRRVRDEIARDLAANDLSQSLDDAHRDVAAAEETMRSVLDNMGDGAALYGPDGTRLFHNAAFCRLLDLDAATTEALPNLRDIVRSQLAREDFGPVGDLEAEVTRLTGIVMRADGVPFVQSRRNGPTLEVTSHRLADGRLLATYRDITELKERELEVARERDAAEAANQAKSTFLAIMSHEIRTPMNGVVGTIELLEREQLSERQKRLVGTVRASAAALLRIIDDVLDFSKIEAGRMELEDAPFSLHAVVQSIADTLSVQAERKALAIEVTIEPGTPDALSGDATRVRQILFNLLGNAIKFTDAGGVQVTARVTRIEGERARLVLAVADSGMGMTEEQTARLFRPFAQADSSTTRRFGGTGLGLSIVRRLAQLMGGGVRVESTPGKGSTFIVELELGIARPAAAEARPGAVAAAMGEVTGTVLAVDDYGINLEVLRGQFEILGVSLDTAGSGIEALTLWRAKAYALVLSDIHMPDMDGFELTRQIRAEEALTPGSRRTPIVALTANAMKGEADRCLAAGMDGYLTKPLTLDRLRETVEQWMSAAPGQSASEASTMADAARPIDRRVVAEMFGDNQAMIDRVLKRFSEAGGTLVAEIVATEEPQRLIELAHKLTGAARAAGAMRLGDLATALERTGERTQVAELAAEWARVETALGAP